MTPYTVAFFGHRYIERGSNISKLLEKQIRELLSMGKYVEFLVGKNGEFDTLASSAIYTLRNKAGKENSAHVLVLPYLTTEFERNQENFESFYSEIEICESSAKAHPKAAISIRNKYMADRADLVIAYITCQSGGAYEAIKYAEMR